jgi:hypothetical protein
MSHSLASWIAGLGCHMNLMELAADCLRNAFPNDQLLLILRMCRRATLGHSRMDHICLMLGGCYHTTADCYHMTADCYHMTADCYRMAVDFRTLVVQDSGWHLDILYDCPHAEHHMLADCMRYY